MDIFALFGKIVASVGGAGLIIIGLSSWIGKIWADKLMETQRKQNQKEIEKFKSELHKELELLKAKNEKMNYITKTQFDAEFKMYQELSESSFELVLKTSTLYPYGIDYLPENIEEQKKIFHKRLEVAESKLLFFQQQLFKYAPFIKDNIHKLYEKFRIDCKNQISLYPFVKILSTLPDKEMELTNKTKEIEQLHEQITNELRVYLQSLKVQED